MAELRADGRLVSLWRRPASEAAQRRSQMGFAESVRGAVAHPHLLDAEQSSRLARPPQEENRVCQFLRGLEKKEEEEEKEERRREGETGGTRKEEDEKRNDKL